MLPKINVTPTKRKIISLNKRSGITRHSVNYQSSSNNINTTQRKRYTSVTPHEKILNNTSKRFKVLNISTKNNTLSNSNFYDNLYYYPPHNKRFSYVNNLSSEVAFLYSDFNFNKAPSLSQNLTELKKIIRKSKINNKNYFDNLFSISIYGKTSTGNISDKNKNNSRNINNTNEIINRALTTKKFSYNNSSSSLLTKNKDKEKMTNLKNYGLTNTLDFKKYTPNKTTSSKETFAITNKDREKTDLLNNYTSSMHETIKFPEISQNEEKNIIKSKIFRFHRTNSYITHLNTIKMNFAINDCFFESNTHNIKNVSSFAKKVLSMKVFQGFQKTSFNTFLDENFYRLRKYLNHIEKTFTKYNNIYNTYNHDFSRYMIFLKSRINEMEIEDKILTKKEIELEFDLENILNESINAQKELEKLLDMRNFLYIVLHRDEKIPNIYSTFYIESKRFLLAKLLIKIFGKLENSTVVKYLKAIPQPIPNNINLINSSLFIVEKCPPLISNSNVSIGNKYVFTSDYEFIKIMKNLEEQIRILLTEHGKKLDLIEKYKDIFENGVTPEEKEIDERLMNNIEIREKELIKIKRKNLLLLQKFNTYHNALTTGDLFTTKTPSKKKDDEQKSSFQDLTYFQTVNYQFLIKKEKLSGLFLFKKLLKNYLSIIKYCPKEIYSKTHPEDLDDIIELSLSAENNAKTNFFLYRYILKLLQLYEYVYDFISKKHQKYKLVEKNLIIMKEQQYIISEKRKLDNMRTLRKLIEKKRLDNQKLIIEKWKRPPKFNEKRNYIGNYIKKLVRAKSNEILLIKKKIAESKKDKDTDVKDLILYD